MLKDVKSSVFSCQQFRNGSAKINEAHPLQRGGVKCLEDLGPDSGQHTGYLLSGKPFPRNQPAPPAAFLSQRSSRAGSVFGKMGSTLHRARHSLIC